MYAEQRVKGHESWRFRAEKEARVTGLIGGYIRAVLGALLGCRKAPCSAISAQELSVGGV